MQSSKKAGGLQKPIKPSRTSSNIWSVASFAMIVRDSRAYTLELRAAPFSAGNWAPTTEWETRKPQHVLSRRAHNLRKAQPEPRTDILKQPLHYTKRKYCSRGEASATLLGLLIVAIAIIIVRSTKTSTGTRKHLNRASNCHDSLATARSYRRR